MKLSYRLQLLTEEWKLKATSIKNRDNNCCQDCGNTDKLHVHHLEYHGGKMAWEYEDSLLITVCETCHINRHKTKIPCKRSSYTKHKSDSPPFLLESVKKIKQQMKEREQAKLDRYRKYKESFG